MIINADDFGIAPGVNEAIIELFRHGTLTSTTLMVNAPATDQAATSALANPGLGVGLHFNLTLGRPVAPVDTVRSLVNGEGRFLSRRDLVTRTSIGMVRSSHVATELNAQYEKLLSLGVEPTHVDSHQHVHMVPLFFDVLAEFCVSKSVPLRMAWVNKGARTGRSFARTLKRGVLGLAVARNRRKWCNNRLAWNDGLCSAFDLEKQADALEVADYKKLIEGACDGIVELMVHPAIRLEELEGLTSIGTVSVKEWQLLRTDEFLDMLRESRVTLQSYREL